MVTENVLSQFGCQGYLMMISQVNLDGLSLKLFALGNMCLRYAYEFGLGKQLT